MWRGEDNRFSEKILPNSCSRIWDGSLQMTEQSKNIRREDGAEGGMWTQVRPIIKQVAKICRMNV